MGSLNCRYIVAFECVVLLSSFFATEAAGQLVYQQKLDKYSAILPLTLDDDVYRVRCKPPDGVAPRDVTATSASPEPC